MFNGFYYKYKYFRKRNRILNTYTGKDDFFLVSYPKSGNTWVRILVANLLQEDNNEISLHNIGDYLPDTYIIDQLNSYQKKENGGINNTKINIYKSHDPYISYFKDKKVLYIARDGRDAITSYFYYLKARKKNNPSIKELINGSNSMPIGNWGDHIRGWINGKCAAKLIVRYEDLLNDTSKELNRIAHFLSLKVSVEQINSAVQKSEFQRLKLLEKKYGYYRDNRLNSERENAFMRKGSKGDSKRVFTLDETKLFIEKHKESMKLIGYFDENQ